MHAVSSSVCRVQAAKELEAAEKARKEAKKKAAAEKAAAEKEAKKEADDKKTGGAGTTSKQSPKAGAGDSANADKATKEKTPVDLEPDIDDEDATPRDAEGNELAVDLDPNKLTAAELQQELTKRGLDVKWQPLKGKKVLVERLQVHPLDVTRAAASPAFH